MGARRFGPDTGRFLQADTYDDALGNLGLSADPLTANRYGLAGGNPVNFVETDGHNVSSDGGGGSAPAPKADTGGGLSGFLGDRVADARNAVSTVKRKVRGAVKRVGSGVRRVWNVRDDVARYVRDRRAETWLRASGYAATAAGAVVDAAKGLRKRASAIGRAMHSASEEVRSKAGGLLRDAGRISKFVTTRAFRYGSRGLGAAGAAITIANNLYRYPTVEAIVRSTFEIGGAVLGGLAGAAACATETIATLGVGIVLCPVLVAGGGIAGGYGGKELGDTIYGG